MILGWRTRTCTHVHLHKLKSVVCTSQLLRRAYLRSQHTTSASRIPSAVQKPQNDGSGASLDPARPGTMPERSVYLVLHTSTPSASWPAVHSKASPLVNNLLLNLKPFHGAVNASYDPHLHSNTFAFPSAAEYPATLYRSGGLRPLFVPRLSLETMDSVITLLKENYAPPSADFGSGQPIGNVNFSPTGIPYQH
jgi:hypothetical protein